MNKICDLHTHSIFSDGTHTPSELIDKARALGLSALALTDHNAVDGLGEFIRASEGGGIDIAPGAEFSADFEGTELHILGLFIRPEYFSHISEIMSTFQRLKEESNVALVESLAKLGIRLDYDEIKRATPNGQVNRAHIATALMQKGYTSSIKQGFDTYLSPTGEHYRAPRRLSAAEIIDLILSTGAVPVLAHPLITLTPDRLCGFLRSSQAQRLVGMECYYSSYDRELERTALGIAAEHGLIPSGGSDFHGSTKPDVELGIGKGGLCVPYECYLSLREKSL